MLPTAGPTRYPARAVPATSFRHVKGYVTFDPTRPLATKGPLDEPTAHLDPATPAPVLARLLGAAGGQSVSVVSHGPGIDR